jgi:Holliday junction resolvasome RuvABC ATP-dependent DNA helicase subunit
VLRQKLNAPQFCAVRAAAAVRSFPAVHLLQGPPGTGKTTATV